MSTRFYRLARHLHPLFAVDDHNKAVLSLLCQYFDGNPEFEKHSDERANLYSLQKGIFLYGDIGCGKTMIMEVFERLFRESQNSRMFLIISSRDVARKFATEGPKGIESFGKWSFRRKTTGNGEVYDVSSPLIRCFDDFGLEDNTTKYYGNECNVMAEVMLDRYDNYRKYGMLTHITSNIKSGEHIRAIYGDRVQSRMREMFNYIRLEGPDRRK